jgi:hypothetical protein
MWDAFQYNYDDISSSSGAYFQISYEDNDNLSTLVLPIRNDIWSWRQNSIGFNLGRAPELLNFDEEEVLHVCNYPARYWGLHHSPRCFAGERESGNTKWKLALPMWKFWSFLMKQKRRMQVTLKQLLNPLKLWHLQKDELLLRPFGCLVPKTSRRIKGMNSTSLCTLIAYNNNLGGTICNKYSNDA